jgi:hypothetical protein
MKDILKSILKFLSEHLVLPIANYFLKKDNKIEVGLEYLDDLISILEKLRDGLKDKEITKDEIIAIHSEVIALIDKIKETK